MNWIVLAQQGKGPRSGGDSPTLTNDNPSSCLGAERASRNSNGGDRAQGGFGQAQSDFVASLNASGMSFGEFLQTWMDACENSPGGDDEDDG
jgi:hypothetical protein